MGLFFHQHPNPPKKKETTQTKNETTDGSNPWSNKAEAYNNLGWLFWDHGDLAQAGYEKRKPWKKKERWEWSVWCVHRKVWKKSRRKKKHFFLIVFNCFFRHQMVWLVCLFTRALSFLEKVVSCGSSSLFQTKKTEVVVKAPCLGYV